VLELALLSKPPELVLGSLCLALEWGSELVSWWAVKTAS
jgi:hypothetical protein